MREYGIHGKLETGRLQRSDRFRNPNRISPEPHRAGRASALPSDTGGVHLPFCSRPLVIETSDTQLGGTEFEKTVALHLNNGRQFRRRRGGSRRDCQKQYPEFFHPADQSLISVDYEIVTVYILPTLLPGKAPCCLPGKHGSQRTVRSLFWSE